MQAEAKKGIPKHSIYKPKIRHTADPGYSELEITVKCTLKGVAGDLHAIMDGKKLKLVFFKDGGKSAIKLNSINVEAVKKALASPSKTITTNVGDIRNIRSDGLKRLVNLDK